jgi:hypothetical protein
MRAIKITNLPSRTQNPNLKENLYDEFVKYGRIISIRMEGESDKKACFIVYKRDEQAQHAVDNLNERLFLQQTLLKVERINSSLITNSNFTTANNSSNNSNGTSVSDASVCNNGDEDYDEYCQKATRTLYIGNLDRDVKYSDLREKLDKKYGDIIEIEIKKDNKKPSSSGGTGSNSSNNNSSSSSSSSNSYAFIQFSDIKSVIKAMRCMSGKCIGNNSIKLGFGKIKPTKILWLDGISEQLKEPQLNEYFNNYCENNVEQILIDRLKCQGLIYFSYIEDAKVCAEKIRAKRFYDKRIMVDFASKEFINSRFEHLLDPKHHLFNRLQQQQQQSANMTKSSNFVSQRHRSTSSNSSHDSSRSSSKSKTINKTAKYEENDTNNEDSKKHSRSSSIDKINNKISKHRISRSGADLIYDINESASISVSGGANVVGQDRDRHQSRPATNNGNNNISPSNVHRQRLSPSDLSHLLNDSSPRLRLQQQQQQQQSQAQQNHQMHYTNSYHHIDQSPQQSAQQHHYSTSLLNQRSSSEYNNSGRRGEHVERSSLGKLLNFLSKYSFYYLKYFISLKIISW